ncbi:MAG: type II secretion system minor pseudopilin GspJ [Gammaproteobacteria bacterium]|nr:type II secretion system minor pseudopilin GspJ [Gammaproteobacteria bacterium]
MTGKQKQSGFTLIELLIALSIFVLLSIMSYSALNAVTLQRDVVESQSNELKYLQMALLMIERDIQQAIDRDSYSAAQQTHLPAMQLNSLGGYELTFTRTGWSNPLNSARSHLQRVRYRFTDNKIYRENWVYLDQLSDEKPASDILLEDVETFSVRFFDNNQKWHGIWPQRDQNNQVIEALPQAVEIKLNIHGWGEIARIFKVS